MKIESSKKYICEYCHTEYGDKENASKCEKFGRVLKEWKETDYLKPFMWYKFYHSDIEIFVFAYKIQYDYDNALFCPCLNRKVSIFSTYYNSYFNITPSNLLDILSIEEGYEKYHLLPLFKNQSIEYEKYEPIRTRIEAVYSKRNKDLYDKISEMADFEIRNRLYEHYKYIPGKQINCELFSSSYNVS